ncbi:hypothetical protein [Schleiferilactobacillus shenzhenensis]|nr:hypothetical protein [Schleiferilactobacillus shenzhenensis]
MTNFWCKRYGAQRWWLIIIIAASVLTALVFWRVQESATQFVFQQEIKTNSVLSTISQAGSRYLNKQGKPLPEYRSEVTLLDQLQTSFGDVYTALDDANGHGYTTAMIQSSQIAARYQTHSGEWLPVDSQTRLNQQVRYYQTLADHQQVFAPTDLTTGFPNGLLPMLHRLLTGWIGALLVFINGLTYFLARQAKDRPLVRLSVSHYADLLAIERREYGAYSMIGAGTILIVTVGLTLLNGSRVFSDSTLSWSYQVNVAGDTILTASGWPILLFGLAAFAQARLAQTGALIFRSPFIQILIAAIIPLLFGWQTQALALVMSASDVLPTFFMTIVAWVGSYCGTNAWLRRRGAMN